MIYFDLDNTLIDYNSSERKAIEFIFKEKYGLVLNNNQTDYWSKISRKYFDYYLSKQITFEEQGKNRFIKMLSYCGYVENEKSAMELFEEYQKQLENSWILFDDVVDMLHSLEGYRLGIISNGKSILYSENYLYKDIKEKVIGKTMLYYPALKDVIKEVICGNEKSKGIIQEGQYKEYLLKYINDIVSAFTETENRNLRIIRSWIFLFRKIYEATTKYYSNSKYYEEILNDFLRYSIWVAGAIKRNKKLTRSTNYGSQDMVYFEGHEYTHIFRYSFIDAWINRDVWSDEDLSQACKSIIKRREQEDVDNPPKIHSTGKALNELRDWYLMEDEQVEEVLEKLVHEVEEGKYAYYDYSNILSTLLFLQVNGLFTGDIKKIQTKMIDMIKKDPDVQEENDFHKNFSSEEIRDKYNELYRPIAEERKIRNREINKEEQEESDIYRSANVFYEHCRKMANYYCIHKSFIEYLDLDKLLALINISNNEDIYTILQAFKTVYFMGNLKDFYMADVQGIKRIIEGVKDDDIVKQGGITRKIALSNFVESLKKDLILLGVEE